METRISEFLFIQLCIINLKDKVKTEKSLKKANKDGRLHKQIQMIVNFYS
jgi:hypothetical protein